MGANPIYSTKYNILQVTPIIVVGVATMGHNVTLDIHVRSAECKPRALAVRKQRGL